MMEGKKFGAGLLVGLIVALGIVASSGGLMLFTLSGSFAPAANNAQMTTTVGPGTGPAYATSTTTAAATTTATESSTIQLNVNPGSTNSTPPTQAQGGQTTTATSATTANNTPANSTQGANAAAHSPSFSADFAALPQQPTVSRVLIIAPILIAFLLGAVIFRVSVRSREDPTADSSSDQA